MLKFILLLLLSSSAVADEWRQADSYREAGFQVLNIIDWGQTRHIAKHPESFHEEESAWLIGDHPSTADVDRLMVVTSVLHSVISYCLPHEWRTAFQYVSIGSKLNAVVNNASIGIKVEF